MLGLYLTLKGAFDCQTCGSLINFLTRKQYIRIQLNLNLAKTLTSYGGEHAIWLSTFY